MYYKLKKRSLALYLNIKYFKIHLTYLIIVLYNFIYIFIKISELVRFSFLSNLGQFIPVSQLYITDSARPKYTQLAIYQIFYWFKLFICIDSVISIFDKKSGELEYSLQMYLKRNHRIYYSEYNIF